MPPTTALTDLAALAERLDATAQDVEDCRARLRNAEEARNQLIISASDEAGMKRRDVAKAARVSQTHVIRVLATSSED